MSLGSLISSLVPQAYAVDDLGGTEGTTDCVSGAQGFNINGCLELRPGVTVAEVYSSPAVLIDLIVRNLFVIAGIILFLMMIYSGFLFLKGETKNQEEAKTVMTTAVIGFVIMFAAFWIVQIVKVVTGIEDIGI
jgi:hypothetical protein